MPGAPNSRSPLFDEALALERLGGDRALFARLCDVFRASQADLLDPVRASGDADALARAAHRVKGSTANFAAGAAYEAAAALEAQARAGNLAEARAAIPNLEAAVAALAAALPVEA